MRLAREFSWVSCSADSTRQHCQHVHNRRSMSFMFRNMWCREWMLATSNPDVRKEWRWWAMNNTGSRHPRRRGCGYEAQRYNIVTHGAWQPLFCTFQLSQVHWQGDHGDEMDGMKGDTIKLLSDDDDRPKRGALWNFRKTRVAPGCVLLMFP